MTTALILGGTRGLGRAYAIRLLAQGSFPIIVGRDIEEARKDPALAGAKFVKADIGNREDHGKILDAAFGEFAWSPPNQVVWCAGAYHRGPMADMHPDRIDAMTRTHWSGPAAFLGAFHHEATRGGVGGPYAPYDLVVIGSVLAHVPGRQHAVLSGLKAAKVHFTRVFSQELTKDLPGSMVLIVNPWGMKTEFFAGTDTKTDSFMEPDFVAELIERRLAAMPREASFAGKGVWPVEVTLDRAKDGSTVILEGPQPPKC
jgi:NAD(P)-dependent dehydrogenase (short-subunit alcohol dehydrogenase family)